MTADAGTLVRQYYDALDAHEYERLEALLTPAFVQHRPDRSFESRDAFVRFMREERPVPDTTHELLAIVDGDETAAARGRVLDSGTVLFEFADFFRFEDDRIHRLDTYAR